MESAQELKWREKCEQQNEAFCKAMITAGYEGQWPDKPPKFRLVVGQIIKLRTQFTIPFPSWPSNGQPLTMPAMAKQVARKYALSVPQLRGRDHRIAWSAARNEVFWLCHHQLGKSLGAIGKYFGNRDHTTVLNGVQRHQRELDSGFHNDD